MITGHKVRYSNLPSIFIYDYNIEKNKLIKKKTLNKFKAHKTSFNDISILFTLSLLLFEYLLNVSSYSFHKYHLQVKASDL